MKFPGDEISGGEISSGEISVGQYSSTLNLEGMAWENSSVIHNVLITRYFPRTVSTGMLNTDCHAHAENIANLDLNLHGVGKGVLIHLLMTFTWGIYFSRSGNKECHMTNIILRNNHLNP